MVTLKYDEPEVENVARGHHLYNDECHVTAFRPISEAAHSWSYDKYICYFDNIYRNIIIIIIIIDIFKVA